MVALLPGPPRELKPLFMEQVLPRLERRMSGVRMYARELRVTGLGESHVEERIRDIYLRYQEVHTTILAAPGEIQIHLRTWSDNAEKSGATLDELVRGIELALGDRIFARAALSLEEIVAQLLIDNRSTIAVAESCTGGLVAERLTRIPGSSNYFLGGAVCYSNEMKSAWADVPAELIAAKGAVSSEVAIALAEGIRKRVRSTLGIGVTGIAGPGGGSEEKPVGTVYVALASPGGTKGRLVHLPGDREAIRFYASQIALDIVRMHFLFQSPAEQNRKTNS
jgi:nicotinamide-nucleotide amidase